MKMQFSNSVKDAVELDLRVYTPNANILKLAAMKQFCTELGPTLDWIVFENYVVPFVIRMPRQSWICNITKQQVTLLTQDILFLRRLSNTTILNCCFYRKIWLDCKTDSTDVSSECDLSLYPFLPPRIWFKILTSTYRQNGGTDVRKYHGRSGERDRNRVSLYELPRKWHHVHFHGENSLFQGDDPD